MTKTRSSLSRVALSSLTTGALRPARTQGRGRYPDEPLVVQEPEAKPPTIGLATDG